MMTLPNSYELPSLAPELVAESEAQVSTDAHGERINGVATR